MPYDFYNVKYGTKVVHSSGAMWMFPEGEVQLMWTSDALQLFKIRSVRMYLIELEMPTTEIGSINGWTPSPNPQPAEVFDKLIEVFAKRTLPETLPADGT